MQKRPDPSTEPFTVHRPSHEEVARHAYALWETGGRPGDPAAADSYWLTAEKELMEAAKPQETEPPATDRTASSPDRASPMPERQATRAARQTAEPPAIRKDASPVFIVVDGAHFRAFRESTPPPGGRAPAWRSLESFELSIGHEGPYDRDSDQAGRLSHSAGRGGPTGASFDERLPMKEEHERRVARELATAIEGCFAVHGVADWYLAAGPRWQHAILAAIRPDIRHRLRGTVEKDLVKQPLESIRQHFRSAASPAHGNDGMRAPAA